MKTQRFDFNYSPLRVTVAIVVDSSVPDAQSYESGANGYTPDYSLTPLVLQPRIGRIDRDGVLNSGPINSLLSNIAWYEIVGGTKTLINAANMNYEITDSGPDAGRIKVMKNAEPQVPITLEFSADYVDSRTNQVYSLKGTHLIKCSNATEPSLELYLDTADHSLYNPLRDADTQVISAKLIKGNTTIASTNVLFVWEIMRNNNTWSAVKSEDFDYFATVSADTKSLILNKKLMGGFVQLRCRAKYSAEGTPEAVTMANDSPSKVVVFRRRIPKYDYDMQGVPTNIPADLMYINPTAYVQDAAGKVDDPDRVLIPVWSIATNNVNSALSYSQVAHGMSPSIPTKQFNPNYGAVIALDMVDPGPFLPMMDSDGKYIVDSDGKVLLI